jgi:hypothetical protein
MVRVAAWHNARLEAGPVRSWPLGRQPGGDPGTGRAAAGLLPAVCRRLPDRHARREPVRRAVCQRAAADGRQAHVREHRAAGRVGGAERAALREQLALVGRDRPAAGASGDRRPAGAASRRGADPGREPGQEGRHRDGRGGPAMERADRACRPEPGRHVPGDRQRTGLDLGRRGAVPAGAVVRGGTGRRARAAGDPGRADVQDQGRAGLADDPPRAGGGAGLRGGRLRRAVRAQRLAASEAGRRRDRVPGQRAGRHAGLPGRAAAGHPGPTAWPAPAAAPSAAGHQHGGTGRGPDAPPGRIRPGGASTSGPSNAGSWPTSSPPGGSGRSATTRWPGSGCSSAGRRRASAATP